MTKYAKILVFPMPERSPLNLSDPLTPATLDAEALEEIRAVADEDADTFLVLMIDAYLEEAPPLLLAIREAIAQQQAEALEWAAHSLKSTSASLGANSLAQLCQKLETIGEADVLTHQTSELLNQLEVEFERVKLALQIERQQASKINEGQMG